MAFGSRRKLLSIVQLILFFMCIRVVVQLEAGIVCFLTPEMRILLINYVHEGNRWDSYECVFVENCDLHI